MLFLRRFELTRLLFLFSVGPDLPSTLYGLVGGACYTHPPMEYTRGEDGVHGGAEIERGARRQVSL